MDAEVRRELDHNMQQILILQKQIDKLAKEVAAVRAVASSLEVIR